MALPRRANASQFVSKDVAKRSGPTAYEYSTSSTCSLQRYISLSIFLREKGSSTGAEINVTRFVHFHIALYIVARFLTVIPYIYDVLLSSLLSQLQWVQEGKLFALTNVSVTSRPCRRRTSWYITFFSVLNDYSNNIDDIRLRFRLSASLTRHCRGRTRKRRTRACQVFR